MTLAEIRDKNLECIIHTPLKSQVEVLIQEIPSARDQNDAERWIDFWDVHKHETCFHIIDGKIDAYSWAGFYHEKFRTTAIYEFSDLVATGGYCNGFRGGKIPTPSNPVPIEEQLGLPKSVSIYGSFYPPVDIEIQPLELVCNKEQAKNIAERLDKELYGMLGVSFTKKEDKKMSTKFTFYVKEGTRPDKKCNGVIPTMTTTVIDVSGKKATVTCDKADYIERQGVLEAIAQLACGGNFDKEYDKAVKWNKLIELHDRTCTYCGKVFDTIAEREEHEAWHVERRKARHERYLLRKRAKEIAFEEAAQKLAKEIIAEGEAKK